MQHLRFLHIPKTAGTTFTHILNSQYNDGLKFQFTGDIKSDIKRFDLLSQENQKNTVLFTGHAPIYTGVELADSIYTITFLRDPIERVKSFCQHVAEGKSPYLLKHHSPENFNLERFLNSGTLELNNLQTKMLLNTSKSAIKITVSDSEALKIAKNNLFENTSYGLVEYFDESLILFQKEFKWKLPIYKSSNLKDKTKLINFEHYHIEKIRELNRLDIELYDQAKVKFIEAIEAKSFSKWKLRKLRKKNRNLALGKISFAQKLINYYNRLIKNS